MDHGLKSGLQLCTLAYFSCLNHSLQIQPAKLISSLLSNQALSRQRCLLSIQRGKVVAVIIIIIIIIIIVIIIIIIIIIIMLVAVDVAQDSGYCRAPVNEHYTSISNRVVEIV